MRATLAAIFLLTLSTMGLREPRGPALDFKQSSTAEKKATLNALAANRTPLEPGELRELLAYGLDDADQEIQRRALLVVAGRMARSRRVAPGQDQERQALRMLRPRIDALLAVSNEQLRLAALLAIGNMELERSSRELVLGADVTRRFADLYAAETSPRIRREIIKTFALVRTIGNASSVRTIVLSALDETDPSTVQYALMAVARLQLTQALPEVAGHLRAPDRRIRMAAAQSLAGLGPAGRDALAQLQQAFDVEQDEITKTTMLGAIAALTRAQ